MEKTLDKIAVGALVTVIKISGDSYIWKRYLSFGILPGTALSVFCRNGSSQIVKIGNTKLAFLGGASKNLLCETRDTERRKEHDCSTRRKPELWKINAVQRTDRIT